MDIELFYTKQGSGPSLLLLHGNGEDGTYFVHQIAEFSKDFTVYAIDTRGHGNSPRGTAPFTISQFADDLLTFMDQRGLDRADILGFSDGGNIALTFALRHPDRVHRLILNGANLDPKGVKMPVQLPIVAGYHLASLFKSPEARAKAELLGLMVKEPHIAPAELGKLTMPVLVIAGTQDMIRESHSRLIAASIPGARLALIPGDHFIANKEPTAFNRAVRTFFTETAPAASKEESP
ncbi:alpha/beta fold hydrolase [Oscillibacter valericigenes]|uniref:alpha/beta fold hydrolase n=1 Tax=Oscillibacter valericigenes TaxID=351091 RepID=UPI001F3C6305|nr:alpha/beta hydrolase [Oscillibacter valericigenes]MCF2665001.1 alpha/beta fold hydrolase [Oscillibacter valericigenes]